MEDLPTNNTKLLIYSTPPAIVGQVIKGFEVLWDLGDIASACALNGSNVCTEPH
ncbi:hypothetical protein EXN66_Car022119 [Channa argus]|uniref:Uncharacterized protein n=1 Tax=Channa argus TaxID=215402 RepID=A0A6G1QVA6_CHAAH|nr:hypothetical protein EXN66_Car022119 [Channa argus]